MKFINLLCFSCIYILSSLFLLAGSGIAQNAAVPVNVGVVLDLKEELVSLRCINMSLSDFYSKHSDYRTRLFLDVRDSEEDVVTAADAALDLIKKKKVTAILGPTTSMQAHFVIELGKKAEVPVISFSATSPTLTSIRSPYYIRATYNDSSQVKAICAIVKVFGWREAVPLYVDNEFGEGIIPYLVDALQEINVRIPYRSVIASNATDDEIARELYKLMTMPTRVFIVHMLPSPGSRVFAKAKEIGMMGRGYVWILSNGITDLMSQLNRSDMEAMHGVLGVKTYVRKSKEVQNFRARWESRFQDAELNIFGLWGYDATTALAMAVEEAATNISRKGRNFKDFGVRKFGSMLLQALLGIQFKGLAGEFRLVNGQLQASNFEIVNVHGSEERLVGYWNPEQGLVKHLNVKNTSSYSAWKDHMRLITWPGNSRAVPKGWEIPTNGKKLRIGVPKKEGFSEFVKITRDPITNSAKITGYSVDVFEAVIEAMPYDVSYEFIPFETLDGKPAGNYNDLVYQVYLGKYDAVVGDTTIVANRSTYVDFTLPYIESGVVMVVPVKDKKEKNAWVFLKPLTMRLWVTTGIFFFLIGFVVWILEHRTNDEFRGVNGHPVSTMFWFSFSTMVFAHRERVFGWCARSVVIIWCFVVLILIQSYTASLTSLLTVQQLLPTVTNVKTLIENGDNVGYSKTSFILGKLKELGFQESKLKPFTTAEECDVLLTKGTSKGGVSAAVIEVPYMKLFLGQYCAKYTMVQELVKVDGFGFVFPIGSPLVADISRAILKVAESEKMKQIDGAWFKRQASCPDPSTTLSFEQLDLNSFWFLFLLAGSVSLILASVYVMVFMYRNWEIMRQPGSFRERICNFLREFNSRDGNNNRVRAD